MTIVWLNAAFALAIIVCNVVQAVLEEWDL